MYCGLANGAVSVFDTRMTRPEPFARVDVPHKRPVHSLAYLPDSGDVGYVNCPSAIP